MDKKLDKLMDKKHAKHLLLQLIIKHGQIRHKEALDVICARRKKDK